MHPAYSVIFFTTASGAGYGLLIWLGLAHLLGELPNLRMARLLKCQLCQLDLGFVPECQHARHRGNLVLRAGLTLGGSCWISCLWPCLLQ